MIGNSYHLERFKDKGVLILHIHSLPDPKITEQWSAFSGPMSINSANNKPCEQLEGGSLSNEEIMTQEIRKGDKNLIRKGKSYEAFI